MYQHYAKQLKDKPSQKA